MTILTNYLTRAALTLCLLTAASLPIHANTTPAASKRQIKKILLVVAMDSEAQPIVAALHLQKIPDSKSRLPMRSYQGKFQNLDIQLITNGTDPVYHVQNIGTQAATLTTYIGIQQFHPDLIISIGTAGGVEKNGAKLKDIYVSQKIYFYDRRIAIHGYHEYGLGEYQSFTFPTADKKIGLEPGIICSGDSFDDNQTDHAMFLKLDCSVVDMEAAGVAWVSMLTKTPMLAMKGVTNFVSGENIHEQYEKNLPIVSKSLSHKLQELLKFIAQTK